MKTLLRAAFIFGLAVHAATAFAQTPPIPLQVGPQNVAEMRQNFNTLIQQINAILVPLVSIPSGVTAVNLISLTGAATGNNATIGLQPGADANAGIAINPNGSGDIVLFNSDVETVGVLKFANAASFVEVQGLGVCPGVNPDSPPFGVSTTITGYVPFKDWTGTPRAFPAC